MFRFVVEGILGLLGVGEDVAHADGFADVEVPLRWEEVGGVDVGHFREYLWHADEESAKVYAAKGFLKGSDGRVAIPRRRKARQFEDHGNNSMLLKESNARASKDG